MDVVDRVYNFVNTLPTEEKYGLCSQLSRAAVSIPGNIAEGSAKSSDKDFARFIEISLGSAYEVETQLIICQRRNLGDSEKREDALATLSEEQRMRSSFHEMLLRRVHNSPKSIVTGAALASCFLSLVSASTHYAIT